MMESLNDGLNSHNDVVRIERLTHHIQRIREDQMDEIRATQLIANKKR